MRHTVESQLSLGVSFNREQLHTLFTCVWPSCYDPFGTCLLLTYAVIQAVLHNYPFVWLKMTKILQRIEILKTI